MNIDKKDVELVKDAVDSMNKINVEKHDIDDLESVYANRSKQFVTDTGIIFARINIEGINNAISLNWHFKNTKNFDDFIKSIQDRLIPYDLPPLSVTDIRKLQTQYENYIKQLIGDKDTLSQQVIDSIM